MSTGQDLYFARDARTANLLQAGRISARLYLHLGDFDDWKKDYIIAIIEDLPRACDGDENLIWNLELLLGKLATYANNVYDEDLQKNIADVKQLIANIESNQNENIDYGGEPTPTQTAT